MIFAPRPAHFLLLLFFVPGAQAATPAGSPFPTVAASPSPAPSASARGAAPPSHPGSVERAWWNQPSVVETLRLTSGQREKMDAAMARFVEAHSRAQHDQARARVAFLDALGRGDWAAARARAAELRDGVARVSEGQTNLKLEIFPILDESQRRIFTSELAHLLRQPWLFSRPLPRRMGPGRGKLAPPTAGPR